MTPAAWAPILNFRMGALLPSGLCDFVFLCYNSIVWIKPMERT